MYQNRKRGMQDMTIDQAVKEALASGGYIQRRSNPLWRSFAIMPTNSSDCCVVCSADKKQRPRWNPNADDLAAEDWEVLKTTDELLSRTCSRA